MKRYPLAVLLLLALAGCAPSTGTSTVEPPTTARSAAAEPAAAPTHSAPTPADYRIRIKILSKDCFGSAGCNLSVRLNVSALSEAALNQAAELTVKVKGDEDGPSIETIDLDDSGNYDPPELILSTRSSKTKITATITDVEADV